VLAWRVASPRYASLAGSRPVGLEDKQALKAFEIALWTDSKNSREQLASFPARNVSAVRHTHPRFGLVYRFVKEQWNGFFPNCLGRKANHVLIEDKEKYRGVIG
jgi:hypothetical protein